MTAALVLAALATVSLAVLPAPPADAAKCTALDRSGTRCRIGDELRPVRPTPGGGAVITANAPPGPRFRWLNLLLACDATGSRGWIAVDDVASVIFDLSAFSDGDAPADLGVIWIGELVDPVTGGTNTGFISCVGEGESRPPLPPPLPTADEIWGAALTFEPAVNLDPYVRGLTGLETFMWYEGPTSDAVSLSLNGYAVTATIQAVEFRWDMGGDGRDGASVHVAAAPGTAASPAASHTYARPAAVEVIHEVAWVGTSVVTGPGLPAGGITVELGDAVLATARAYDVIEVRAPLVGGSDEP